MSSTRITVGFIPDFGRPEEAQKLAAQMLGKYLITKQTGAKGKLCNKVRSILFLA